MRIILQRNSHPSSFSSIFDTQMRSDDTVPYVRSVFAHITDKIWIKNISVNQGKINIEYERQPGTSNIDFNKLVRDAVSLRGDLTLVSLTTPKEIIEVKAFKAIEQEEDSTTFRVNHIFINALAKEEAFRERMLKNNIVDICYEYEQIESDSERYVYTGRYTVCSRDGNSISQSPYAHLAEIMKNNPDLRDSALSEDFVYMKFKVRTDGTASISISMSPSAEKDTQSKPATPMA